MGKAKREASGHTCQPLDFGLPASRNVRKQLLWFRPPSRNLPFCYGSPSKLIESLCLLMALGIWGILHLAEPTCHHQSQKMAVILSLSPPHTEEEGLRPRLGQRETSTPRLGLKSQTEEEPKNTVPPSSFPL